ncbi:hypothetical protein [Mesorhizobium sp.]|uniref:hypothetical protein n=1 Tax=Mesorhizobium sp. TaxID=1871066 RepID=UPI000FE9E21C|nr:hypothetical protein [Mesorhizobium sp.]RWM22777.1 MAG: hypothetical protein EOR74_27125 [Mesorhizobium sp.]RWM33749.1 MAG: hypothetical protein EOR75_27225 [Mesorhizobium sp.]TIO74284.1 MAG: hypothetical protein E5X75_24510 [Mesorhizobium sp.]TIO82179.1 MAG: hypothetical protein E5X74_25870 [Mesorhizobium sp.]TJV49174.1 MAG: hypothetical protein E5Y01_24825 [Mesorhizobium sp.]
MASPILMKIPFRAEGRFDADQTDIRTQRIAQRQRPRGAEIPVFSGGSECTQDKGSSSTAVRK